VEHLCEVKIRFDETNFGSFLYHDSHIVTRVQCYAITDTAMANPSRVDYS